MAKKANKTDQQADTLFGPATHIRSLIEWMSQGVYEKEHIIAAALLCAVAGENIFLLGPPGTAKSMVASRLKMIFRTASLSTISCRAFRLPTKSSVQSQYQN